MNKPIVIYDEARGKILAKYIENFGKVCEADVTDQTLQAVFRYLMAYGLTLNEHDEYEFDGDKFSTRLVKKEPTVDPVKHSGIDHIKSLYFSDGLYVINEWSKCSECKHNIDDFGQKFCSNCGAKLDGEHHFFRKKTTFVEGENALVPISYTEYKCAEDWEYEIDRC